MIHHAGKFRNRFFPIIFFLPLSWRSVFRRDTDDDSVMYPENALRPFNSGPEDEPCLGPVLGPPPGWWFRWRCSSRPPGLREGLFMSGCHCSAALGVHSDCRHNRIRPVERGGAVPGPGPSVCLPARGVAWPQCDAVRREFSSCQMGRIAGYFHSLSGLVASCVSILFCRHTFI
jgi:hypothetical protein